MKDKHFYLVLAAIAAYFASWCARSIGGEYGAMMLSVGAVFASMCSYCLYKYFTQLRK